ncbi:hypothetical protein L207DRAFT_432780 [Hyaloscypha variabilis F]|uniref:Uncharacterized protein n=1 Tax=Hyaloscypha variabilis (strain UAMH 11265 / GT02V1 / F) TaxID=1149755 RepID=A0A2J6RFX2_HYAVF|nr:hypothetical protein L207DRAFT_432780 [Hyaloscypha variabilis F]
MGGWGEGGGGGGGEHGYHRKLKSSRRTSSTKSAPYSDPEENAPIRVTPSFLFLVRSQELNEDTEAGGLAPRTDPSGFWYPPVYAAGFGAQQTGTLYRWDDGAVTRATDTLKNSDLTLYRAVTMFYCNPFYQFCVTEGDASQRNMPDCPAPQNRWYPLGFEYGDNTDNTVSYLEIVAEHNCLAGNRAGFIHRLGLDSYSNPEDNAPLAGGLAGNLAMLVALIAFTCGTQDLETVLIRDRSWHHLSWREHGQHDGRDPARGLVVSIYLDPRNPLGSTSQTLYDLERNSGPLLS